MKADGAPYYELLLVYIDNIMLVSTDPDSTLKAIGKQYELKEDSLQEPDTYLGAQIYRHHLPNGTSTWAMSSKNTSRTRLLLWKTS